MSKDWADDIHKLYSYYGFHRWTDAASKDPDLLKKLLEFRTKFLEEELEELKDAEYAEDVVDALIDLCVVAIGTLDLFKVVGSHAWNKVLLSNTSKQVGVNPTRENQLGLPDLVKPDGWKEPDHSSNVGLLKSILPMKGDK